MPPAVVKDAMHVEVLGKVTGREAVDFLEDEHRLLGHVAMVALECAIAWLASYLSWHAHRLVTVLFTCTGFCVPEFIQQSAHVL